MASTRAPERPWATNSSMAARRMSWRVFSGLFLRPCRAERIPPRRRDQAWTSVTHSWRELRPIMRGPPGCRKSTCRSPDNSHSLTRRTPRRACASAGVAVAALEDLEEEAFLERLGEHMEQLAALGVAVVENVVVGQFAEELVVEIEARGEVVVIVQRDFQQCDPGLLGLGHGGEDVGAIEGDVVHAGTAIAGQRTGDGGVAVLGYVQRQAHAAAGATARLVTKP